MSRERSCKISRRNNQDDLQMGRKCNNVDNRGWFYNLQKTRYFY